MFSPVEHCGKGSAANRRNLATNRAAYVLRYGKCAVNLCLGSEVVFADGPHLNGLVALAQGQYRL